MDYDVLLSHHSADKHLIRDLHRRLQAQDLRVWLDEMDQRPGMSWPERLAAGTLDAPAVLVCIGGSGSWDNDQLRAALTLAEREQCLVIPVLLPGALQCPEMSLFHMSRTWVDLSRGFYPAGVGRLVWGITGTRPGGGGVAPDPRFQLPADLPDFIGRTADRDWVAQCLTAGRSGAICALTGQGGLGKTALAVHVAHHLRDHFADGQVVIALGGAGEQPLCARDAMAWVIRAFAPERRLPDDATQVQAIYRSVLSGRRVLILADDAAGVEQVAPLVPSAPAAMILTSRRRIALGDWRDLDPLVPAEACALLAGLLGEAGVGAAAALERLAAACDRLPLALRVAGSHLAMHPQVPLDAYLAQIEGEVTRLAALPSDAPLRGRVGAVLVLAADRLLAENLSLGARWQSLACFPAPFDRVAAAAVWGLTGAKAAQSSLSDLIDRSLLHWDGNTGRYRLHDLLSPIAAAPWCWCRTPLPSAAPGPSPENLAVARGRHSAHFLAVLRAADQRVLHGRDGGVAGLAAYDADAVQIAAGQAWAAAEQAEGANRLAMNYPDAGADVLSLRLPARARLRWLESGLAAARRLGERRWEGVHLGNLGVAWAQLGEPRKAIGLYEQQLAITREIGDRRGEGAALGHLGGALADRGELRKAIGCYGQRLVIAREIGDRRGEATTCEHYGMALERLGDRPGARFWMHAARGIYELIESPRVEDLRRWLAEHPWTPGVAPDAQPKESPDRGIP